MGLFAVPNGVLAFSAWVDIQNYNHLHDHPSLQYLHRLQAAAMQVAAHEPTVQHGDAPPNDPMPLDEVSMLWSTFCMFIHA